MKKFWVPIKFTVKTEVEADAYVEANSPEEAATMISIMIQEGNHRQVLRAIDNTDTVYEQCANSAEWVLNSEPEVDDLRIEGEVHEDEASEKPSIMVKKTKY